jgi:hypothetical protein
MTTDLTRLYNSLGKMDAKNMIINALEDAGRNKA